MRDDGGGGGSYNALLGKFEEMLSLMADRSIDEIPTGEFAENSEDAFYRTVELQGLLHGDREEVTGGYRINVTSTTQGVDNQTWYVLTREAPEWSTNRSKYEGELETLRTCIADLESWRHGVPISSMEWVYEALYQRDFLKGDDFTDLEKEHPEIIESVGDEIPVWENIQQMGSDTSSWDGQFIKALSDIYLLQLPHILMGQMAVTGYLLGSLQMSEAAVKAAEDNVGKVLDGTISALEEAAPGGVDISLSSVLDVVSKATALAGAVVALVPGGQGVAGGLALTSVLTDLGSGLAGKIEGKPDDVDTEPHWDAGVRRFREVRDRMPVEWTSPTGAVTLKCQGLRNWHVSLKDGSLDKLSEVEFCNEVRLAAAGVWWRYQRKLALLRKKRREAASAGRY